ncbi:Protein kinase domain [Macleaya cordata]|uniref:cyclin-dependent kinase n=1 Tax=Macleaya cordata TaxID=56857 RepID=A0A200QY35_MACCD|nr:Protein kinase domain [Macleaya cordata]
MAAGRHGGYRDNEFKDRESDIKLMRRKCLYYSAEGIGDRDRNLSSRRDSEWGKESNGLEKSMLISRQKDNTVVKEVINGGHRPSSITKNSGINGSFKREIGFSNRTTGNSTCELSSAFELQVNNNEFFKSENGVSSPLLKKRKFSPIVWDREEKEVGNSSKTRVVSKSSTIAPPMSKSTRQSEEIISVRVSQESSTELNQFIGFQSSIAKPVVLPCSVGSTAAVSQAIMFSSSPQKLPRDNDHEQGQLEEEEFVPRNISASRWADVNHSPGDKVPSPEPGELTREGSEEIQAKPLGSVEEECCLGSLSKGEHSDRMLVTNDFVDIDKEDMNNNVTVIHSDTDSEGESYLGNSPKRSINMLQGCRSVHEFERLNRIDEGTYGVVFRARDKRTGEIVALKKVKMEKEREGFPLTSLREINILLSSNHPSIVDVKEVVMDDLDSIFMVMEYMEHDLKGLMETMRQPFSQSEVKCLMLQLLEGVKYLHDNWVLHRDLKTSNILLNNRGELKICDFGMSRQYGSPLKPYTHLVVTLWYRAPELLLGEKQYSTAIDMWSLGCIMAELLSKEPLFNGKTEFDQLDKIFRTLGTPSETIWPGFSKLPGVKVNFVRHQYNLLRKKFPPTSFTGSPVLSDAGFDLLNRLLTYDPEKRITAQDAVNHEWFREVPLPKSKDFMPTFPAQHAQDRRQRRVMKSPDPLEEQWKREMLQERLGTGGLFG